MRNVLYISFYSNIPVLYFHSPPAIFFSPPGQVEIKEDNKKDSVARKIHLLSLVKENGKDYISENKRYSYLP